MSDPSSHNHDEHADHGGSGKYFLVFLGLCFLTALSFGVANSPIMENKEVGWLLMMAVSVTKAMLVIMFFMHLIWEANWKYVLTIPASIMSVLLVLALVPDVKWRFQKASPDRLLYSAEYDEATLERFAITEGELALGAKPQSPPDEVAEPGDQYLTP